MEQLVLHKRGCEVLARFGNNVHGKPMYRIVKASSREQWSMGEWRPKYPKYGDAWIIETWCHPDKYGSRDMWEEAKDDQGRSLLGPYPEQGDYEFVIPVLDASGNMITNPGEHHITAMGFVIQKSQGLTRSQRWAEIQDTQRLAKEQRMKVLEQMIHDAKPLRGGAAERKYGEAMEEAAKNYKPTAKPTGASLTI